MASSLTSPAADELDRLRQQYDRLCDVMTRAAESDPVAAEQVLGELQALSQRILALESGGSPDRGSRDRAAATGPGAAPDSVAAASPPPAVPPAPTAEPSLPPPSQPPQVAPPPVAARRAAARPSRIVAFRVSQAVPAATPAPAAGGRSSWRLDAPPAPPDGAADAGPAAPTAPAASARTAGAAGRPAEDADAPPKAPANAVMFSSAIRDWLKRHRDERGVSRPARRAARPAAPADAVTTVAVTTDAVTGHGQGAAETGQTETGQTETGQTESEQAETGQREKIGPMPPDTARELSRLAAAVEQQALQIERILALCTAHQEALENLQRQLAASSGRATPADDPRVDELGHAVEEQRRRITALAKTIHNLAQWLAAQRGASGR